MAPDLTVLWGMVIGFLVLLACSGLRHELFRSASYDLGLFDQVAYLISRNQPPLSSFLGYSILGDHAAWIWYLIAQTYRLYPTVYWLLGLQALALVAGGLPTWFLALQAGLNRTQAGTVVLAYLLYPLVFNVNLLDFHPEVLAVPLLLGAVLGARQGRSLLFGLCLVLALGCKGILALTVVGLGIGLWLVERRRGYGVVAIGLGLAWFWLATQVIVPAVSGRPNTGLERYKALGESAGDIGLSLLLRPWEVAGQVLTGDNVGYLLLLLAPVLWAVTRAGLPMLVGAIPCLGLNLLANYLPQKDIVRHYSAPILPFLVLMMIATLAAGQGWLRSRRAIVIWSTVAFVALAKWTYFTGPYWTKLDTWQATREAIARVPATGSVLTTAEITPHLSHRSQIRHTQAERPTNWAHFDHLLLNLRHPGWQSDPAFAQELVQLLRQQTGYQLQYQRDDVYLFSRGSQR